MSEYKRNPRGARRARKSMGRKAIVVLSLMLVLAMAAVGGTLAWLTDSTDAVTNTFTTAGIDITLTETVQSDGNPLGTNKWSAQLVPGKPYTKNPVVSVITPETDVPIYLFVEFVEKDVSFVKNDEVIPYIIYDSTFDDNGSKWKTLSSTTANGTTTTVWYREWDPVADKDDKSWNLLNDMTVNGSEYQVVVNSALEKDDIPNKATEDADNLPCLTYTAYAIQQEGFADAAAAWAEVSKLKTTN